MAKLLMSLAATQVKILIGLIFCSGRCDFVSVSLRYSQPEIRGISMAEFINVSLTSGDNGTFNFMLKKVTHMAPNIPLHALSRGPEGHYTTRREMLGDNENTGFYQDVANEAVMEIKRTNRLGEYSSSLLFKGQFRYNGTLYTISRETRAKRDQDSLADDVYVLEESPEELQMYDYILPRPQTQDNDAKMTSEPPKPLLSALLDRKRRQTTATYYVDIVAVIDYRAYSRFLGSSATRLEALQNLLDYYTLVITGVDLLYQGITASFKVRVRLIKVIVAETAKDSAFTEEFRISGTPNDIIDSSQSLAAFSRFVAKSSPDVIGPYDHAMLFTRFNITEIQNGVPIKDHLGLAYVGTLCTAGGQSSSLVEDLQGLSNVSPASHELGHSMSARHDGENNTCSFNDHFIMAAIAPSSQDAVNQNPWKFSSCSAQYFTEYISKQLKTTTGISCLMEKIQADADIPDVSYSLPGLKYPADEQCKMLENNNGSFICTSLINYTLNADPTVICRTMYCKVADVQGCNAYLAADGTLCGDGKLCLHGECVSHESAPQSDETCLYGDDRLFSYRNLSCADAVRAQPRICYDYAERCCISCKTYYRLVQGCEYGDKSNACQTSHCSVSSNLKICCATCDYGTPITTMETTTLPRSSTSLTATTKTTAPLATTTAKTLTTSSSRATLTNFETTAPLATTAEKTLTTSSSRATLTNFETTAPLATTTEKTLTTSSSRPTVTIFETTAATELTSSVNKTENARSNTEGPSSFHDMKCLLSFLLSLFFISL
ncbi:unnamed protein product [Lymnaea stagnalis]|uniref:Peptidase M12B domain-containing protein n=1 Tax=Lymnaea stagnalis TaxID=6523 RepID=A0AAV2HL30_LYMST